MTSRETKEISLKDKICPAFYKVHAAIVDDPDLVYFWLKGGRGSTKSSFAALEIISGMMEDPNANAIALRKFKDTLRTSTHALLQWAIDKLDVSELWESTVSPMEFTYIPTGQKILERGLDDAQKLKSISLPKGYFKFVWFEELAEFYGPEEVRNTLQSLLRGGASHVVLMTYNPPDDPASWVNKEAEIEIPSRLVHHSTYLDVPPEWLGQQFIKDAEILKQRDFDKYRHEYKGEVVGRSDIAVFGGKWVEEDFTPGMDWDGPYYGGDWGFANDPTALVKMWLYDDTLWIEEEAYGFRVDIDDTPALFSTVSGAKENVIRADCSRPETISYMNKQGWNVVASDKWEGCVEDGVTIIRGFKRIVIHSRCKYMQDEARHYSHKVDRLTKDVLPAIVDKHNHLWDAVRYGLGPIILDRLQGFLPMQMEDIDRAEVSQTIIAPAMDAEVW